MIEDKELMDYFAWITEQWAIKNGYPSLKEFNEICLKKCESKGKECNPSRDGHINRRVCIIGRILRPPNPPFLDPKKFGVQRGF